MSPLGRTKNNKFFLRMATCVWRHSESTEFRILVLIMTPLCVDRIPRSQELSRKWLRKSGKSRNIIYWTLGFAW
jgi:hypothetical protein